MYCPILHTVKKLRAVAQNGLHLRPGAIIPRSARSEDMSKLTSARAHDANMTSAHEPQISNTPTVTSTGSVYWNVRDIVFGPNRTSHSAKSRSVDAEPSERK